MQSRQQKDSKDNITLTIHPLARTLGSSITALTEAAVAYPLDKFKNKAMAKSVAKMPMLQRTGILLAGENYKNLTTGQFIKASYRGIPAYALHKVANRGLKLGLQTPCMETLMSTDWYKQISTQVGKDKAKLGASFSSGVIMGFIEVAANPVDRLKIICQLQNKTVGNALKQMKQEGFRMQYTGWKETMVRNGVGSGSLFLGKFLGYQLMGVTDHNNVTFIQSMASSALGSAMSITISHLPDVAKVRAQKDPSVKMGMTARLIDIAKKDGVSALAQGYTTKLLGSGLKLAMALVLNDMLVQEINKIAPTISRYHQAALNYHLTIYRLHKSPAKPQPNDTKIKQDAPVSQRNPN